jgi:transposase
MAMGREGEVQGNLMITWAEAPRSPGHVFYDRLQNLLGEAGFDAFVEETCKPFYAPRMGAPSLPPGRYFRMHMIGYFEGLDSERGIVWRCSDSRSLEDFLRLGECDKVPDHSWLSKTRSRLPHEVHEKVFAFLLKLVAEHGLVKGERIGVDASTMEANAAPRAILRRDNGETYSEMLTRMAKESGVETPTIDDLIRLDRKRKGKKLSKDDWASKTDMDAKIAKMKDGSTHLAYKPEHAVDLDIGVIVAAPIHEADRGDPATLDPTLKEAEKKLSAVGLGPTPEEPCDLVADKGYHSRDVLKGLDNGPWKTRISEPRPRQGYSRWHGDDEARAAVYGNPQPLEVARRQRGHAQTRRDHRTQLRPCLGAWRDAPNMVARPRKGSQTIPRSCRGLQSRHSDARAVRRRHAEGDRQRQICVPVRCSGRRYDRLCDPRRLQRRDGRVDCRHHS